MNESLMFFSNFIKNPKETGALTSSSKFLTKEIIKNINFKAKNIVELGPGSGVFTKPMLKKARHASRVFSFEINKKFCSYLEKNITDKRLKVINAPAEKLKITLKRYKISSVGCVVSGIPFLNFAENKRMEILNQVKDLLDDGGRFILFQYTNGLSEMLESCFSKVERKFIALNVPPSFVYVCEK